MKVTIITATYNSESHLQETINSVLSQSYKDIEYIVIDGGSTDRTLEIIKENKDNISKYVSERDNGIYDALNKGIKLATGDIIGFLNSDDVYNNSDVVSEIVQTFKNTNSDIVYGNIVYMSNGEDKKMIRYWKSNDFRPESLKFGWMPPHPSLYCRKKVYDESGSFYDSFKIAADYEFILRVFSNKSYVKTFIPLVLVQMELGGVSNNSFKNICIKSKEDYQVIRRNKVGGLYTVIFKNLRKLHQFTRVFQK